MKLKLILVVLVAASLIFEALDSFTPSKTNVLGHSGAKSRSKRIR